MFFKTYFLETRLRAIFSEDFLKICTVSWRWQDVV